MEKYITRAVQCEGLIAVNGYGESRAIMTEEELLPGERAYSVPIPGKVKKYRMPLSKFIELGEEVL